MISMMIKRVTQFFLKLLLLRKIPTTGMKVLSATLKRRMVKVIKRLCMQQFTTFWEKKVLQGAVTLKPSLNSFVSALRSESRMSRNPPLKVGYPVPARYKYSMHILSYTQFSRSPFLSLIIIIIMNIKL